MYYPLPPLRRRPGRHDARPRRRRAVPVPASGPWRQIGPRSATQCSRASRWMRIAFRASGAHIGVKPSRPSLRRRPHGRGTFRAAGSAPIRHRFDSGPSAGGARRSRERAPSHRHDPPHRSPTTIGTQRSMPAPRHPSRSGQRPAPSIRPLHPLVNQNENSRCSANHHRVPMLNKRQRQFVRINTLESGLPAS